MENSPEGVHYSKFSWVMSENHFTSAKKCRHSLQEHPVIFFQCEEYDCFTELKFKSLDQTSSLTLSI